MTTRASRQNPRGADSLTLNYGKRFKTDTFDIIVGNPPYQDGTHKGPLVKPRGPETKEKDIHCGQSL